jgi:hypothetical protein
MTDYGRTISCTDALRCGRYVTGVRVVAEAAYRRLTTRPGELYGSPDYGMCVSDWLGASTSTSDAARLPGLIRQQLLLDPRLRSVDVSVSESGAGADVTWTVTVIGYTDDGPFTLVASVSDVTTSMLEITT